MASMIAPPSAGLYGTQFATSDGFITRSWKQFLTLWFAQSFAENEFAAGLFNGVNVTFTLLNSPNPASSLALYQNGLRLSPGDDFSVFANTITMVVAPAPGSKLMADYRYLKGQL